jgi:hypothetical protein
MECGSLYVRLTPIATKLRAAKLRVPLTAEVRRSKVRPIRSPDLRGNKYLGHVQAESLCSLEIYNQFELGRLLYRQITGLLAVQNSIYVTCRLSKLISYNPSYGLLNEIVRVRRGIA